MVFNVNSPSGLDFCPSKAYQSRETEISGNGVEWRWNGATRHERAYRLYGYTERFGMIYVVVVIHVLVSLFLIGVVLLQSGEAADIAGAFGGMGSQTTFGPRGSATPMSKATQWAAVIFMITSLSLAIMGTRRTSPIAGSVLDNRTTSAPAPAKQQQKNQPNQQPAKSQPAAPKK
jgi:preprotein translocase subunit SecG